MNWENLRTRLMGSLRTKIIIRAFVPTAIILLGVALALQEQLVD